MGKRAAILLVLIQLLTGCERSGSFGRPLAPSSEPPGLSPRLLIFTDRDGFATSELRDAQDEIVHFNTAGELIWAADGARFPGYAGGGGNFIGSPALCRCALEVRFGTQDGQRHAYLTAEYGHYNPGTMVDLERVGGSLVMTQTDVYPPGTPTLSGLITEMTLQGPRPVEGAWVARLVGDGWREAMTDANGAYAIRGLSDYTDLVSVAKEGYRTEERTVTIAGDTRFDMQLVRR